MQRLGLLLVRLGSHAALLRRPRLLAFKLRWAWRAKKALTLYRNLPRQAPQSPVTVGLGGALLTVAMPVYRVAEEHLRAAIASVRQQTHSDFQFLLLDDASPEPHVSRVLAAVAREDSRVELLRRATNGGLTVAANDLLRAAKGRYVAFVDHDDLLPPHALASVVAALQQEPATDWLFSDEDKVDLRGQRRDPCFKPGFARHLLVCWNLCSHFRVLRTETAEKLGGYREGFEGAQDWDLALRFAAAGARFTHLPSVLYHWRISPRSMAAGARAKAEANLAARRAIEEFLAQVLPHASSSVAPLLPGASLFRVRWQLAERPPVLVLLPPGQPPPAWRWPHELLPLPPQDNLKALSAALARAQAPLVTLPILGMDERALAALVALVALPGTGAAAGRWAKGGRVSCSGWVADGRGGWLDPWQGLSTHDPGYCNLAWLPQPRGLLPPGGWVAWREPLVTALDCSWMLPTLWALGLALAQMDGETVVTPWVTLHQKAPDTPPFPPPGFLPALAGLAWPRDPQRGLAQKPKSQCASSSGV